MRLLLPKPSDKQLQLFRDKHKYVAYGGARGGGKSWGVRVKAVLLCLRYPGIKILIIRRTYPELQSNHIQPLRALLGKQYARYNDQKKEYVFPNGSTIAFRYCATDKDLENFQGLETDILMIDEATQMEESAWQKLKVCVRGANAFPKRAYLTCNPGGRGHAWVKRLFIDRKFKPGEMPEDYSFIQSFVADNTALMAAQPDYVQQLEALPDKLRRAWLLGDWNVFEGQFFEEFTDDPRGYDTHINSHVINAFPIPRHWKRYRSFDWGSARPFSCGWWVVSEAGTLYRIAELYGCTNEPNTGVRWPPNKVFAEIKRIECDHPDLKGHHISGIADPALWDGSRDEHGITIADMAAKQGIYFEPGNHARIAGWMQMHYRMAFDERGMAGIYIFRECVHTIRTLPTLIYDEHKVEDLDTEGEDHVADEIRYMCMRSPVTPPIVTHKPPKPFDPLDISDDINSSTPTERFFLNL